MSSKCPVCGYDESGIRSGKIFEGASKGAAVGGFLGFASGTSHQKCKKCGHTWED